MASEPTHSPLPWLCPTVPLLGAMLYHVYLTSLVAALVKKLSLDIFETFDRRTFYYWLCEYYTLE